MDKVKMKLRQKPRGSDKQTKAAAADGGQSGIVTPGVSTSNNDGVQCEAEKSITNGAKCEDGKPVFRKQLRWELLKRIPLPRWGRPTCLLVVVVQIV